MATRVTDSQFRSSIVRILGPKGLVVGMGFLVGDREVITCQHVAAEALGPQTHLGTLRLDFPLAMNPKDGAWQPEQSAQVARWAPYFRDGVSDVVILELTEKAPSGCAPVCLVDTSESALRDHDCYAFGYPNPPKAGERPPPGGWSDGILKGRVDYGWVQLQGTKEGVGYFARPGFSGSPVWDKNEKMEGVVGIIVGRDREVKVRVAFVIPSEQLVKAWAEPPTGLFCDIKSGSKPVQFDEIYVLMKITREDYEENPEKWKKQIAKRFGLKPNDLQVGDPEPAGSIRVRVRLPKSAADQVSRTILTQDPMLGNPGIVLFDEPGVPDVNDFPSRRGARKGLGMSG